MAGVYSFGFIIHAGQPHNKCGPFGCGSGGELPLCAALHILQHDTTQGGASLGFGQSVSPWACTATTIATIEMKIKKFFILSGCSAQRWIKTLHRKQDLNKRMALNSVSTSLLYPFFFVNIDLVFDNNINIWINSATQIFVFSILCYGVIKKMLNLLLDIQQICQFNWKDDLNKSYKWE